MTVEGYLLALVLLLLALAMFSMACWYEFWSRRYRADLDRLRDAAQKVIDMNRDEALHRYGDHEKAEQWGCVKVLRAGMRQGGTE